MPRFLNATQARGEIESILTRAQKSIFMISPYIKINDDLISRLTDAGGRRKVKILLVCREKDLRDEERKKVEQVPNLELHFNEKVHAKCYFNEESMVIASLNLYDSAHGDNHEMGILLSNLLDDDKVAFRDAAAEAEFIISEVRMKPTEDKSRTLQVRRPRGEPENPIESVARGISKALGFGDGKGYCIRCAARIPMDRDAPYCPDCYRVWAKYKKADFEEGVCHSCGRSAKTSTNTPLCASCFARQR